VFADPNSPAAMTGGFYAISAIHHDEPLVAESFRTGAGPALDPSQMPAGCAEPVQRPSLGVVEHDQASLR